MFEDLETISAEDFGRGLRGFGVNLLVKDVLKSCVFLETVLLFNPLRKSVDFAILGRKDYLIQLHGDHTYHSHPLPSLLPENGARGAGLELRLYEIDPDGAEARAVAADYMVLQSAKDKPHGLRECFILDPDGYCWVPSTPSHP